MTGEERRAWLALAHSYTAERYAAELPDKLLVALACAPRLAEHELRDEHSIRYRNAAKLLTANRREHRREARRRAA